jgi:hypothetical protein
MASTAKITPTKMAYVDKGEQITSLKKRLAKIDVSLDEMKAEQRQLTARMNELLEEKKRLEDLIETLIPKKLTVSDHAILRYIERVMGVDVDAIRQLIASEKVENVVATLGDAKVPLGNGAFAVVKNHAVVTVTTVDPEQSRKKVKRTPTPRGRFIDDSDDYEEAAS